VSTPVSVKKVGPLDAELATLVKAAQQQQHQSLPQQQPEEAFKQPAPPAPAAVPAVPAVPANNEALVAEAKRCLADIKGELRQCISGCHFLGVFSPVFCSSFEGSRCLEIGNFCRIGGANMSRCDCQGVQDGVPSVCGVEKPCDRFVCSIPRFCDSWKSRRSFSNAQVLGCFVVAS
jgi:hypothetical protein